MAYLWNAGMALVMMKELSSIFAFLHVTQRPESMHGGSRDSPQTHWNNFVYRLIVNFHFVMGKNRSRKYVKHRTSNNLSGPGHGLRSDEWRMGPGVYELCAQNIYYCRGNPIARPGSICQIKFHLWMKMVALSRLETIQLTRIPFSVHCARSILGINFYNRIVRQFRNKLFVY